MDTRDKRASVLGLGLAALLVLPEPGTIDQPDRQHVAYCYRGIEASEPVEVTPRRIRVTGSHDSLVRVTGSYDRVIRVTGEWES